MIGPDNHFDNYRINSTYIEKICQEESLPSGFELDGNFPSFIELIDVRLAIRDRIG
jgi:hypothetical protein